MSARLFTPAAGSSTAGSPGSKAGNEAQSTLTPRALLSITLLSRISSSSAVQRPDPPSTVRLKAWCHRFVHALSVRPEVANRRNKHVSDQATDTRIAADYTDLGVSLESWPSRLVHLPLGGRGLCRGGLCLPLLTTPRAEQAGLRRAGQIRVSTRNHTRNDSRSRISLPGISLSASSASDWSSSSSASPCFSVERPDRLSHSTPRPVPAATQAG